MVIKQLKIAMRRNTRIQYFGLKQLKIRRYRGLILGFLIMEKSQLVIMNVYGKNKERHLWKCSKNNHSSNKIFNSIQW